MPSRASRSAVRRGSSPSTRKQNVGVRPSTARIPYSSTPPASPSRKRRASPSSCSWIRSKAVSSEPSPSERRYSIAATVPATASCDWVPVSKRGPGVSSAAGRTRSAGSDSARSGRIAAIPRCGPKNLYGEQSATSRPVSRARRRRCGARCTPSAHASAPAAWAAAAMRAGSVRDPTAFDASVKATTRVRSPIISSSASWSSVTSSVLIGAWRTTRSWSAATKSQGEMFASWSSWVTTISSPGRRVRATACASRKLSVVMLAPKAIPSGSAPVKSAAAARPRAITSSESAEVGNAPPRFAFDRSMQAATASSTSRGHCDPPGPSRYAAPLARAGKRSRTAATSSGGALLLGMADEPIGQAGCHVRRRACRRRAAGHFGRRALRRAAVCVHERLQRGTHALGQGGRGGIRPHRAETHPQALPQDGGRLERVGDDTPVDRRHRGGRLPLDLSDQGGADERALAIELGEAAQLGLVVLGGPADDVCVGGVHGVLSSRPCVEDWFYGARPLCCETGVTFGSTSKFLRPDSPSGGGALLLEIAEQPTVQEDLAFLGREIVGDNKLVTRLVDPHG